MYRESCRIPILNRTIVATARVPRLPSSFFERERETA